VMCGFPPAWPGVKPNNYVPDPEKVAGRDVLLKDIEPDEDGMIIIPEGVTATVDVEDNLALPWEDLAGKASEVLDRMDEDDGTIIEVEPETVPLEEQLPEDGRVPQVHIDSDNYYHCKKCDGRHKYNSGVGKKHLGHKE